MKKSSREALDAYYREADSWATDRLGALQKSRRIAWWVASGAAAVAALEALALALLMPLKTVEPYTLLVDRNTGYVQALSPLAPSQITPDRALVQSMLVQYVIGRESFDVATVQADYRKIALWSGEQARTEYLAMMQPTNVDSPLTLYPRTTTVETRVKSVSRLDDQAAMVRFDTFRRDAGGRRWPAQAWVAIVRYRFSGEPMSAEDRFLNPLGFQVLEYRRDQEALPQTSAVDEPISEPAAPEPFEETAP